MRNNAMGPGSINLFNFRGHHISVSGMYLILILFIVSRDQFSPASFIYAFAVTFSILWHEFGHAFAFSHYNCGPSDIILHGFGGLTVNPFAGRLSRWKSIASSAAGPLAGLALGLPLLGAYYVRQTYYPGPTNLVDVLLTVMIFVNIGWSIFNLLPIYPLDGGHIFMKFIAKWTPKSGFYTAVVSVLFLVPLIYFAVLASEAFMIVVFALLAFENYQLFLRSRSKY